MVMCNLPQLVAIESVAESVGLLAVVWFSCYFMWHDRARLHSVPDDYGILSHATEFTACCWISMFVWNLWNDWWFVRSLFKAACLSDLRQVSVSPKTFAYFLAMLNVLSVVDEWEIWLEHSSSLVAWYTVKVRLAMMSCKMWTTSL